MHGDRIRLAGSKVNFIFRQEGPSTVKMRTDPSATGTFEIPAPGLQEPHGEEPELVTVSGDAESTVPELIEKEGAAPKLIGKDSDLFRLLQSRTGTVVSREEIGRLLWPELVEAGVADQVIEQCIGRLRANVEEDPEDPVHLITAGEFGYLLV